MKFNLNTLFPVIEHFKTISNIVKQIKNEYVIFCPYCDDATRELNPSHGHLYLSIDYPVFHCFRCSTSGSLAKLLIFTGFEDNEILQYVSSFIKYDFVKDYSRIKQFKNNYKQKELLLDINSKTIHFYQNHKQLFEQYKDYIISRIGDIDFSSFLISPGFVFNNKLCCDFHNSNQELILSRLIGNEKIRYKINEQSTGLYYFQNRNFNKYKRIVLTEGPFDLINLFIYNHIFNDAFFMSISGVKYFSSIEYLLLYYLLIGEFELNIIFDSDTKRIESTMWKIKKFIKTYNSNITVKFWIPQCTKDTGDYPDVKEVNTIHGKQRSNH